MIYLVDIENIPNRYSDQWRKWHVSLFKKHRIPCKVIGSKTVVETKANEFMSFIPSNEYKAKQVIKLAELMKKEKIKEEDTVYFLDAWHPGVISLFQMRIFYPFKFKIKGFFHAGSYDKHDILGPFTVSLLNFERSLYSCLDASFFATEFSKKIFEDEVLNTFPAEKGFVTGFLYNFIDLLQYRKVKREKMVLFPHRLAPEKHPELFDELAKEFPEYKFVKTMEVAKNKKEYYELLGKAAFSLSFADQETFGISMMESLFCGCVPLVPDKLSYKELFHEELRYKDINDLKEKIRCYLDGEYLKYARIKSELNFAEVTSGKNLIKAILS